MSDIKPWYEHGVPICSDECARFGRTTLAMCGVHYLGDVCKPRVSEMVRELREARACIRAMADRTAADHAELRDAYNAAMKDG